MVDPTSITGGQILGVRDVPCVAILGTCDTKLDELLYVRMQLLDTHRVRVQLIDVGRTPSTHPAVDIAQSANLATSPSPADLSEPSHPESQHSQCQPVPKDISTLPRNDLITTHSEHAGPLVASLVSTHTIHALLALGGSGGSALAAGVFRALPLGFSKLLISTMAAGDVGPFVGDADVAVMYGVVDIAGLNDIICPVLANAAGAAAGMAHAYHMRQGTFPTPSPSSSIATTRAVHAAQDEGKRVAITMFGVTTPAVTHARALLAAYPCTSYVFHATGAGGRALERLVEQGFFHGVLDLTTTELADELVGGVLSAGPHRLEAAAQAGVPQVISLGALDMVNFGPKNTVPERWTRSAGSGERKGVRRLYEHNPSVTLMRTTLDECTQLGIIVARKLRARGARADRTEVWVPRGGVSALSVKGAPFEDREADEALFHAVREGLQEEGMGGEEIRVVERDEDINDPRFVEEMVGSLMRMMQLEPASCFRSS